MMKPFTCVCLLSAAGSLLYLYQEKHAAQVVDREIGGLIKQSEQIREHSRLMQAQYQMLNDPERLAQLATQHLTLQQLAPAQYVKLSDLGSRLPGPMASAPEPAAMDDLPETPAPATMAAASPAAARAAAAIVAAAVAPVIAPTAIAPVLAPMPAPAPAPVLAGAVAAAPPLPAHAAAASAPALKPALMAAAPRAVVPVKVAAPAPINLASRQVLQHHDEPAVTQVGSQARPAYPAQTLNPPEPARPAYVPPSNPQPYYAQSSYPRTAYAPSAYAQPVYAPSSYAPPGYPALMPAVAAQRPQPRPPMVQNTGADGSSGGSALGMARTPMAPPVPVANAGSPYDR